VNATMPAADNVAAMLEPSDALQADDEIALSLRALRKRRIVVDPGCPPALLAAVRTHPALEMVLSPSVTVDAALDCGLHPSIEGIPTLRVRAEQLPIKAIGALQWSSSVSELRRIGLDAQFLRVAAQLTPRPIDNVLLAAGGEPLIVSHAGAPTIVETALDFGSAITERRPEVPLLVDFAFGRVLGADLLNEIAMIDRGPRAALVASVQHSGVNTNSRQVHGSHARDIGRPFIVAALLVLIWEIYALGRQYLRLRARSILMSA